VNGKDAEGWWKGREGLKKANSQNGNAVLRHGHQKNHGISFYSESAVMRWFRDEVVTAVDGSLSSIPIPDRGGAWGGGVVI